MGYEKSTGTQASQCTGLILPLHRPWREFFRVSGGAESGRENVLLHSNVAWAVCEERKLQENFATCSPDRAASTVQL